MTLQLVDPKSLYRLKGKIEKLPDVLAFLSAVDASGPDMPVASYLETLGNILTMNKRVRENQHMTAILVEIRENLEAGNVDGAVRVARRVMEAGVVKGVQHE